MSNKTDSSFAMNSLDFEIDTGMITAFSTQSEKCYMRFSFINEDTNETAAAYKCEVDAGQCTMTEKKVDTKELPQYFLLTAELVDKNDKVISETYHVDKYTKIMQEIAETDIHDFDEDRVVNFDENEDTNFIVLSDDTVIAESSDTENSLVSADFDNNTFVFEHIDESIQYLQNGDFLYVQPDEENIIAVSVDNVDIDGDTATVTGSDDIDDMLAFIKFETTGNMEGAEIDTSDSDFVFPGHEDETKFTMDEDKPVEFMYNSRKPIGAKLEAEFSTDLNSDPAEMDDMKVDDPTAKIAASFKVKFSINFCKKWTYTSFSFLITPEFIASLKIELSADPLKGENFPFKEAVSRFSDSLVYDASPKIIHFLRISVPTGLPGMNADIDISLVLEITGTLEVGIKYTSTWGYKWDSDNGGQNAHEPDDEDSGWSLSSFEVEGKAFIDLIIEPGMSAISPKIASVGLKLTAGIEISVTPNFGYNITSILHSNPSNYYKLSENKKTAVIDSEDDYIHSCDLCFDGEVCFKIELDLVVKILGGEKAKGRAFGFEIPMPSLDFYFGYPNFSLGIDEDPDSYEHGLASFISDCLGGFEFGKRKNYTGDINSKTCPHYKYKTPFEIFFDNGEPVNGALIKVDSLENRTNNYGQAHFYCDIGTHSYSIEYGGILIKASNINVLNNIEGNKVTLIIKTSIDESGNTIITDAEETKTELSTSTTSTTESTTHTHTYTTMAMVNKEEDLITEAKQLGENVWGMIYPDGFMLIIGHGDMYSNLPTYVFENIGIVKQVVFEDDDPENGQYITSIGNNLFMNAEKLEYVYLSNEITKINDRAFANCEKLKCFRYGGENDKTETFVLPAKLKYIGTEAFFGCESAAFGDLVFNENAREIGPSAFYGCKKITSVTIPETVTKIEPTVFKMCSNITNAVIKADIDEMGAGLFYGCPLLEDLVLPKFSSYYYYHPTFHTKSDGEAKIDKLFDNCENSYDTDVPKGLKKITVLSGKEIPDQYFMHMAYIDKYALPEGITKIGSQAFYDNSSLTKIICIDENKDLSFLELFKDVEEFGDSAFFKDEKLEIGDLVFNNNVKSIGTSAFLFCPNVTSVVIPESVESIGPTAFYGCSEIKTAVIKTNIDEMGAGLFYDCNQMQELTIQGFPTYYYSIGTRMFYDTSVSMLFYNCSNNYRTYVPPTLKKVNIMSGTEMPENALDSFIDLKILSLPNELKLVGKHATHDMTSLEEVIYSGTEEEWNEIDIKEQNDPLLKKIITFAPVEETEWITGDANGDGELDMSDIVLIMQALANPDKFGVDGHDPTHITANGFKYADTNGDGLTVSDAANIQKFLLGLSDSVSA